MLPTPHKEKFNMNDYQCIIAAVDLDPETDSITIARAKGLTNSQNTKLYLIHAIESLKTYGPYVYPAISEVKKEIWEQHKKKLVMEAKKQGIATNTLIIERGTPNIVIIEQAKKLDADLIVIGAHSRHGLRLLFGSTTDSVLHNTPCDVLAVHLKK